MAQQQRAAAALAQRLQAGISPNSDSQHPGIARIVFIASSGISTPSSKILAFCQALHSLG